MHGTDGRYWASVIPRIKIWPLRGQTKERRDSRMSQQNQDIAQELQKRRAAKTRHEVEVGTWRSSLMFYRRLCELRFGITSLWIPLLLAYSPRRRTLLFWRQYRTPSKDSDRRLQSPVSNIIYCRYITNRFIMYTLLTGPDSAYMPRERRTEGARAGELRSFYRWKTSSVVTAKWISIICKTSCSYLPCSERPQYVVLRLKRFHWLAIIGVVSYSNTSQPVPREYRFICLDQVAAFAPPVAWRQVRVYM